MIRRVVLAAGLLFAQVSWADGPRAVVELFTSQGCSSCPPADAIAGRLSANPAVLVLSFHVNYWDDLGWKDPFGSQASTDRQNAYASALGERSVFTPQVIVNGAQSLVGSQERAIQRATETTGGALFPVRVDIAVQSDKAFSLSLAGSAKGADLWEVRYVRHATTKIRAGENGGRTLDTFNNVTSIRKLGTFAPGTIRLAPLTGPDDGLAVLVQARGTGAVLGAAAY